MPKKRDDRKKTSGRKSGGKSRSGKEKRSPNKSPKKSPKKGPRGDPSGKKKNGKGKKNSGKEADMTAGVGFEPQVKDEELPQAAAPLKDDLWEEGERRLKLGNMDFPGNEEAMDSVLRAYDVTKEHRILHDVIRLLFYDCNFGQGKHLRNLLKDPDASLEENLLEDFTGMDDPSLRESGGLSIDDYELNEKNLVRTFEAVQSLYLQPFEQAYSDKIFQYKPPAPITTVHTVDPAVIVNASGGQLSMGESAVAGVMPDGAEMLGPDAQIQAELPEGLQRIGSLKRRVTFDVPETSLDRTGMSVEELKYREEMEMKAHEDVTPGGRPGLKKRSSSQKRVAFAEAEEMDEEELKSLKKKRMRQDTQSRIAAARRKARMDTTEDSSSEEKGPPDLDYGDIEEDGDGANSAFRGGSDDEEDDEMEPLTLDLASDDEDVGDDVEVVTVGGFDTGLREIDEDEEDEEDEEEDVDDDEEEAEEEGEEEEEDVEEEEVEFLEEDEVWRFWDQFRMRTLNEEDGDFFLYRPHCWKRIFYHKHGDPIEVPENPDEDGIRAFGDEKTELDASLENRDARTPDDINTDRKVQPPAEIETNLRDVESVRYVYDMRDLDSYFFCPWVSASSSEEEEGSWFCYRLRLWVKQAFEKGENVDKMNWYGSDDPKGYELIFDHVFFQNCSLKERPTRVHVGAFRRFADDTKGLNYEGDNEFVRSFFMDFAQEMFLEPQPGAVSRIGQCVIGSEDAETHDWYENGIVSLDAYVPSIWNVSMLGVKDRACGDQLADSEMACFLNKSARGTERIEFDDVIVRHLPKEPADDGDEDSDDDSDAMDFDMENEQTWPETKRIGNIRIFPSDHIYNYHEDWFTNTRGKRRRRQFPPGPWLHCRALLFANLGHLEFNEPVEGRTLPQALCVTYPDEYVNIEPEANRSDRPDNWTIAFAYTNPHAISHPATILHRDRCLDVRLTTKYEILAGGGKGFREETLEITLRSKSRGGRATQLLRHVIRSELPGESEFFVLKTGDMVEWSPYSPGNSHIVIITRHKTGRIMLFLDGQKHFDQDEGSRSTKVLEADSNDFHTWRFGHRLSNGANGDISSLYHGYIIDPMLIPQAFDGFELNLLYRFYAWRRHVHLEHLYAKEFLKNRNSTTPF